MIIERDIRRASMADLDDVVQIHLTSLADDVLPGLGKKVLLEYYKNILIDEEQQIFVVEMKDKVIGFCQVSTSAIEFRKILSKFSVLIALIRLIILRPLIVFSGIKQAINSKPLNDVDAEISFIAVAPANQGTGIGRALLDHANNFCKKNNITTLQTKTANQLLKDFYLREYRADELGHFDVNGKVYSFLKWSTDQAHI